MADDDCETCGGDPLVCASIPGLHHCEKATREADNEAAQDVMDAKAALKDGEMITLDELKAELAGYRSHAQNMTPEEVDAILNTPEPGALAGKRGA